MTSSKEIKQEDPANELLRERVSQLRKERGWTLEQLSKSCGVSRSMLSQVERGQANPTLALAYRIAQAFNVSIVELVESKKPTNSITRISADDKTHVFRADEGCKVRTLSPLHLEKDVEFYELTLDVGCKMASNAHFRGTREFITVHRGRLKITAGEDEQILEEGDSAHYPADNNHCLENQGKEKLLCYLVVTYNS